MTSDQLKSFITHQQCCSAVRAIRGYKQVSRGGKDPFCDAVHTVLSAAYLEILSCEALKKTCSISSSSSECDSSTIEGEWIVNMVCVDEDCETEYSDTEFVGMIDQVWTFSATDPESDEMYSGSVDITSEHIVGTASFSWKVSDDGTVESDFAFEPPIAYEGTITLEMISCDSMSILFEQEEVDPVTIYLTRVGSDETISEEGMECTNYCLTDSQICDIVYWFKRYCADCNDSFEPQGLTR